MSFSKSCISFCVIITIFLIILMHQQYDNPVTEQRTDLIVHMQSGSGRTGNVLCELSFLKILFKVTGRKSVYFLMKQNIGFTEAFNASYIPIRIKHGNIKLNGVLGLFHYDKKTYMDPIINKEVSFPPRDVLIHGNKITWPV